MADDEAHHGLNSSIEARIHCGEGDKYRLESSVFGGLSASRDIFREDNENHRCRIIGCFHPRRLREQAGL